MTALVLENLAALPVQAQRVRILLKRLIRAIDATVSARAARSVPEWRMRQVRSEINRFHGLMRAGKKPLAKKRDDRPPRLDCFACSESAICNFSR